MRFLMLAMQKYFCKMVHKWHIFQVLKSKDYWLSQCGVGFKQVRHCLRWYRQVMCTSILLPIPESVIKLYNGDTLICGMRHSLFEV